ncbi:hypothetical protein GCM10010253_22420 [Streptomyces badius]|uniref:Uncharacterized protein n=1 Tax=Streptomyces badius TaxID=1941 RepID=A0ABQ2T0P9_STRBA|nr:hypothetical protein GCM10010253_22420 [Streptomyces badius]
MAGTFGASYGCDIRPLSGNRGSATQWPRGCFRPQVLIGAGALPGERHSRAPIPALRSGDGNVVQEVSTPAARRGRPRTVRHAQLSAEPLDKPYPD